MPVEGREAETYYLHPDHAFADTTHPRLAIVTDEGDVIRGRQGTVNENGVLRVEGRESHFARCPAASDFRQ